MTSFKILAAAALLSAAAATPVFAATFQGAHRDYVLARFDRAAGGGQTWCLHDYGQDEVDCAYATQSQCDATALGGLGECSMSR